VALNIYGQLCGYCLGTIATAVDGIARAVTEPTGIDGADLALPVALTELDLILYPLAVGSILAALTYYYATRQKEPPEDEVNLELERYGWLKKARKDKDINEFRPFYASYNDARKGLVKASDVRFTCPALFEESAMLASQRASNANSIVSVDPALPKDAAFQKTAYFAVIVTKERLFLHFKYNKLSTLDPFTVPIDLSKIQADPRGVVREGKELKIRTSSGTIPLALKCASGEFNEIVDLLMDGGPRIL
jgi:hypothetical protein